MKLSKILSNKIYWQTMADRLIKKDMQQIYCKKCESKQCYKQCDDGVNYIICPVCGYKEIIKQYFNK